MTNRLQTFVKDVYHRNVTWNNLRPVWGSESFEVTFRGEKISFCYDSKAESGDLMKYWNYCLHVLGNEAEGYFQKYTPRKAETVIDAGANFGAISVYLSRLVGSSGKVLAFEPDPANRLTLNRNLKLNNCTNVEVLDVAVFDYEGKIPFTSAGSDSHFSLNGSLEVQASSLDVECAIRGISPQDVSFIKMDIEGAEIEAIEGAKRLLIRGKPHLAIASYHERNGEKTHVYLENRLKDWGYKVETDFPRHLTTWASK
ncbi:FkbM family methyltransferase [Candidatus Pacearchaeota archaeon]|nr:FkbM family methyltransferase [Candidatus Pacearchaeota archaeon]